MNSKRTLTLGVILPHTRIFGGVKRFFEIGNLLMERGHKFFVFTPEGKAPDWFDFRGEVLLLDRVADYNLDALFITEPDFLGHLKAARTRLRIFYAVLQRRYIRRVVNDPDLLVLANSASLYRYLGGDKRNNVIKCAGGIDPDKFQFRPRQRDAGEPFVVLAYGRFYRRKKGTMLVVKACEQLARSGYPIKLLLFDSPVDDAARKKVMEFKCKVPFHFFVDHPVEKVADLYHQADLFVSAERNAGWSNTSAEAMASGVPVIATRSGTEDFLIDGETGLVVWRHPWFIRRAILKLYKDEQRRRMYSANARKKIEGFSWRNLAIKIEGLVSERISGSV